VGLRIERCSGSAKRRAVGNGEAAWRDTDAGYGPAYEPVAGSGLMPIKSGHRRARTMTVASVAKGKEKPLNFRRFTFAPEAVRWPVRQLTGVDGRSIVEAAIRPRLEEAS
jgi:hypothetical protein